MHLQFKNQKSIWFYWKGVGTEMTYLHYPKPVPLLHRNEDP